MKNLYCPHYKKVMKGKGLPTGYYYDLINSTLWLEQDSFEKKLKDLKKIKKAIKKKGGRELTKEEAREVLK